MKQFEMPPEKGRQYLNKIKPAKILSVAIKDFNTLK
jgi:hypothetical protein